jgi:FMN phosphatase YigB (HAD superfamily)
VVPFDLVTSFEHMHATKPHAAYYEEIAKRIGCVPKRMLMVGNDPKADIVGASSAGLHTHLVRSASEALAEGSAAGNSVLSEIRAWLG